MWRAIRDVLVALIAKGQLPLLLIFLSFIIPIWKLESKDTYKLLQSILDRFDRACDFLFVISIIVLLLMPIIYKYQRRIINKEMDRLAKERDKLFRLLGGDKNLGSSES